MDWVYDDGGRAAAGFTGRADDCVVRAIAIATQQPYGTVYSTLHDYALADPVLMARLALRYGPRARAQASPRAGVHRRVYDGYLAGLGWSWTATMRVGEGCTTHLRPAELPTGRLIARLSRHVCAVIDGVVHDTGDPSRGGRRCVYGYWQPPEESR
jgi:hypothetical protein